MYVIVIGNPRDGFSIIMNEQGFPWFDQEKAIAAAEAARFDEPWWIHPVDSISDVS